MKAKNLKEAKELIKRYETITLEEIKKAFLPEIAHHPAMFLTGCGSASKCIMCKGFSCNECIYYVYTVNSCFRGINEKTYNRIKIANTPRKLLNAYRARAKHIKEILKKQQ